MNDPILQLKDLVIGYPSRVLSSPINLSLPAGANLGIIGENGSGKSTLVKTLMGLTVPLSGSYRWKKVRLGYVPQENRMDTLIPLNVEDLLKMGIFEDLPRWRRRNAAVSSRIDAILEEMEIGRMKTSLVQDLSSGERQRALIARAWINRPEALILDEPFSFLDYLFKEKFWKRLAAWQQDHEFSIVLIDHDLNRIINEVEWLIVLGPKGTVFGPAADVLHAEVLSQAYGAPLHVHQENGHLQVHFL